MSPSLLYSDGWHPTVNPSARMPVHHHRFVEQAGSVTTGVLNEAPRRRGGSTIRLMRWQPHYGVTVTDLPSTVPWMPWWMPCSDRWASNTVRNVYRTALADPRPSAAERATYERIVDQFDSGCATGGELTVGEVLHQVLEGELRRIAPDLPRVQLISVTRWEPRAALAAALASVDLEDILGRWASQENQPIWSLGVGTSLQAVPLILRFHATTRTFMVEPLDCDGSKTHTGKRRRVTTTEIATMLLDGRLVPGSRLMAVAEVSLAMHGWRITHIGNTYQRLHQAAHHLADRPLDELDITWWPDNEDSWHYADIPTVDGHRYPLHLLDVATCCPAAQQRIPALINTSVRTRQPVHLPAKESLDDAIHAAVSD